MLLPLSKLAYDLTFNQKNVTEDKEVCLTEQNLHRYGIYFPESVGFQKFCSKTMLQGMQGTMYCFTSNNVL